MLSRRLQDNEVGKVGILVLKKSQGAMDLRRVFDLHAFDFEQLAESHRYGCAIESISGPQNPGHFNEYDLGNEHATGSECGSPRAFGESTLFSVVLDK